jgi:hypothetical protein
MRFLKRPPGSKNTPNLIKESLKLQKKVENNSSLKFPNLFL